MYQQLLFPVLRRFDPEWIHERALAAMELGTRTSIGRAALSAIAGRIPYEPVKVAGITFPNVLGVAAGFDKDVRVARALGLLGFGHVEVGTLTPKPQPGNDKPRIFRLPAEKAIINRMGFPNGGVEEALSRLRPLRKLSDDTIIGVSLGKQKTTELADAEQDYVSVMERVYTYSDYLAVNISSPNTPGLRELQGGNYLGNLCSRLVKERDRLALDSGNRVPLFVKIAPDMTPKELDSVIEAITSNGIDGIIATNTTLSRQGLRSPEKNETGGLSGAPVRKLSTGVVRHVAKATEGKLPIIAAGGVYTADHVLEKLDAGASLVQIYTGFIYEGPGMAGRILRELADRKG